MKYTAINIGPIIATLGMARKPRELWAASFMFSHLMKCVYSAAEKAKAEIISPAKPENDKNKVGIYPDRIYMKGDVDEKSVINEAVLDFYKDLLGSNDKSKNPDLSFFNIMSASCDEGNDSSAIACLNQQLDVLELCNYATDGDAAQSIYDIISEKRNSPLFNLADGQFIKEIKSIEEIASAQITDGSSIKEKSHHRYFCVVQADGDNIGKTVSQPNLPDGKVMEISKKLVEFGNKATYLIEEFGGLPIYAGGDDLLFLAPVIGENGKHIFQLLDEIEDKAFNGVHEVVDCASLSFGVSISYYKYPLYEALESARHLLFDIAKDTKRFPNKKALACSLRKHSGGTFEIAFSLNDNNRGDNNLKKQFTELINATTDDDTVSAIAHKVRQHEELINLVLKDGKQDRLNALFKKVLEFDAEKEHYFNAVKKLMPILYTEIGEENYSKTLYSLLRIAKFLKGEDLRDE